MHGFTDYLPAVSATLLMTGAGEGCSSRLGAVIAKENVYIKLAQDMRVSTDYLPAVLVTLLMTGAGEGCSSRLGTVVAKEIVYNI